MRAFSVLSESVSARDIATVKIKSHDVYNEWSSNCCVVLVHLFFIMSNSGANFGDKTGGHFTNLHSLVSRGSQGGLEGPPVPEGEFL